MPITYDAAIDKITVTGYTAGTPCNFTDVYNADKAGTLPLHHRNGITGTDGAAVSVDRAERPADYIVLGGASNDLYITIENWVGTTATIRITGTDRDGAAQTEDIVVTANGTYFTTKWFKTITHTQVTVFTATSLDYELIQGQWGVVCKTGDYQFLLGKDITLPAVDWAVFLQIGDGSTTTWFKDTDKQIIFAFQGAAYFATCIKVKDSAHLILGEVENAALKTSRNGCSMRSLNTYHVVTLLIYGESTDEVELYSCLFSAYGDSWRVRIRDIHNAKLWNLILAGSVELYHTNGDHFNITIQSVTEGIEDSLGDFDTVVVTNTVLGLVNYTATNPVFKNITFRDNTYILRLFYTSTNIYLINADTDTWAFNYIQSPNAVVYRQYEFDLKIMDKDETAISGVAVKIWDKDNNLVVDTTTGAGGTIATQTLNYGYYNQAGGDTPTMQTPHTIQISKAGYQTYKKKFTLDEKINWRIRLLQATPVQFLYNAPILQLCSESQEDDRTLFEVI